MKIALVNPNFYGFSVIEPPLGLAYLAAVAKKSEAEVFVLDAHAEQAKAEDAAKKIVAWRPLAVGIRSSTPQLYEALKIAENIKRADRNIVIIFGGPHPSVCAQEVLESKVVDIAVRGEGNIIFDNVLKALRFCSGLAQIQGISWVENERIIHNPEAEPVEDLNQLDFPNWDDFKLRLYRSPTKKHNPYLPMMSTWGCPYSCIYCFRAQKKYRKRSAKNFVDELEYLMARYQIKETEIIDDNFTLDMSHAFSICDEIIARKIKIPWNLSGGIRVDAASRETLERLKRAGCYAVSFGVESGSQKVLDAVEKKTKLEQIRQAVRLAKSTGLRVTVFVIFGLPHETRADMEETISLVNSLDTDFAQFQIAMPYPGTALFKMLKNEGRLLTEDWSLYDRYAGRAVFEMGATKAQTEDAFRKAVASFYMRPKFILKQLVFSPIRIYRLMKFFIRGRKMKDYFVSLFAR